MKAKKKNAKKRSMYYINPKDFREWISQYYESDIISEELGKAIFDIAHHLGYRPNFINYSYKEEMIGDAIVKMVQALENKNFDPDKGNAFSYFNKIAWWAFVNRIKKENKEHEMVATYREEVYNNYVDIGYIPDDKNEHNESENY